MTPTERKEFAQRLKRAQKLDDAYLNCRLLGHSWHAIEPDRTPMFGRLLVWECARCTTKRDDIFDSRWGDLIVRSYRYPSDYQVRRRNGGRGGRTFDVATLRLAYDQRNNG